jgi:microcystin synthetase protein McyG
MLLREGGSLIMGELFKNYSYLTLSFGLVDGWWRFSDEKVRTTSPLVDPATWEMLLMKSRFNNIRSVEISNGGTGCMVATSAATKIPWKSQANAKTWVTLAFGDDLNLALGSNIQEKLKTYGRENILVKFNNNLDKIDENSTGFSVNPTNPTHFVALFDKLKNIQKIEGILYLATQDSQNSNRGVLGYSKGALGVMASVAHCTNNFPSRMAMKCSVVKFPQSCANSSSISDSDSEIVADCSKSTRRVW